MKSEIYTYQDILNMFPARAPSYPNQTGLDAEWFTKLLGDLSLQYRKYAVDGTTYTDSDVKAIVNSVMTLVYDRHAEDYVLRIDSCFQDADHVLTQADVRRVISKIVNILNLTLPKYLPLLKSYKSASVDPIAPIKSETIGQSRFNDTPQNAGVFGDEDHTTNISNSKSESSVDTGSLMERLSALYKDYKSIVLEWSNEFNRVFFKEEQFSL